MPAPEPSFVPHPAWILPFVAMVGAIAVLPLAAPHFWESNLRKLGVSLLLGIPVAVLYAMRKPAVLGHATVDYVSFILLLGALFAISGGILLKGDLPATPAVNTGFLAFGGLLASFVGTTGASMLLIRPLLETNSERRHVVHTVVFFIFIVSNVGGCLTPLGDPPLFLGYLVGVPFAWTLRLAPLWALCMAVLLVVYFVWDRRAYATETLSDRKHDAADVEPLSLSGKVNLLLLLGVVGSVAWLHAPWREVALVALAAASLALTPRGLREENRFGWGPILEVAALFVGIFATMLPALDLLRDRGSSLGVTAPWHFFWATGTLSSFLDNAPTYLTFLALAQGQGLPDEVVRVTHEILLAISAGAVFMGANTYIGNGPNFMVRAIAEERGVKMPSFVGYMKYSGMVLIPLFVLVTLVFFRP
jgi:Na+/H+ antiporter NhaD/arsenite permease-like protein